MNTLARLLVILGVLSLNLASVSATTLETRVEFSDTIVRVKDKTAVNGGIDVTFEDHAAVYHLDKKLLRAALNAKKSGRPVFVSVQGESMRIVKLKLERASK